MDIPAELVSDLRRTFDELAEIGRQPDGWWRLVWSQPELEARAWFERQASDRGLEFERDRNGNLWAWWRVGDGPAVVSGSHLDSVPAGGAYDGALGVVSALVAVSELRRRGFQPARPLAVVAFSDEEGSRFGVATCGSRLTTGIADPAWVRERVDGDGVRYADAMAAGGLDPLGLGADPERVAAIGSFVELHVEQGRALADVPAPIAIGQSIWPHGRWRLTLVGATSNHAGTTPISQRRDPTLALAEAITATRRLAEQEAALGTVGRILVEPNGANSVSSKVTAWLDVRAPSERACLAVVSGVQEAVGAVAASHGVEVTLERESWTPLVEFDHDLRTRLAAVLNRHGLPTPELPTGAGHDAAFIGAQRPAAMLFVRNPGGISHSPLEEVGDGDDEIGVAILADVLAELVG